MDGGSQNAGQAFNVESETLSARVIASGGGWRVCDVVCTAGPHVPAFEEVHDYYCIASVVGGTFRYRTPRGEALMAPGAFVLGNAGECFECGHDHSAGDRCLAFHYEPEYFEGIVAGVAGVRSAALDAARLPAVADLTRAIAEARAGAGGAQIGFESLALELAGSAIKLLAEVREPGQAPSVRDQKRIGDTLRYMESEEEAASIADLANVARMSPYHFVRTFRRVVGVAPHQHLLRTRLLSAATRIRASKEPISAIAFDCGFNDLSTFNRMFRAAIGVSPSEFRKGRGPSEGV